MSTTSDLSPPAEPAGLNAAEPDTDAGRPAASRQPRRSWSVVALVTRLLFYTGVLVAPFLAVAAITGLLFAFTP